MPRPSTDRRLLDRRLLAAVAAGGALGAPARYGVSELVHVSPGTFPWTTLAINVSGALVLGLLLVLLDERLRIRRSTTAAVAAFAGTGFLGAYTTFSTFAVETDVLVKDGHTAAAVVYVAATLGAGLAASACGVRLGRLARTSLR